MGVRGMLRFLREKVAKEHVDLFEEAARSGGIDLLIDFYAFAIWLSEKLSSRQSKAGHHLQSLEDYCEVEALAARFAQELGRAGVSIVAFIDGSLGAGGAEELKLRLPELEKRIRERSQCHSALQKVLESQLTPHALEALPLPALFFVAVESALRAAGARCIICEGEADPYIGKELRESDRAFAVLGSDTDFALMRASRFIHFENFDLGSALVSHLLGPRPDESTGRRLSQLRVALWRPTDLAAVLGVEPERLPDVAFFCGTDRSWGLLERCRARGLNLEPGPREVAEALQRAENTGPLSLLSELPMVELREAEELLLVEHSFYGYMASSAEHSAGAEDWASQTTHLVRRLVRDGLLPKATWPLYRYAVKSLPTPVEETSIRCAPVGILMRPLRRSIYSLLRAGLHSPPAIVEYGRSLSRQFDSVKVPVVPAAADILQVRLLDTNARRRLWSALLEDAISHIARDTRTPVEVARKVDCFVQGCRYTMAEPAVADASALAPGTRLQAQDGEGVWRTAEVEAVTKSERHKGAPVKVHFLGQVDSRTWVGVGRLRSKVLKHAVPRVGAPSAREAGMPEALDNEVLQREVARHSLAFIAGMSEAWAITEAEFDALALMAMLLGGSEPGFCGRLRNAASVQGCVAELSPPFRCLCLGERFQTVLLEVAELAQLLGLAGASPLRPSEVFHGGLFVLNFMAFTRAGSLASGGSTGEALAAAMKLRSSSAFATWRQKLLDGRTFRAAPLPSAVPEVAQPQPSSAEPSNAVLPIAAFKDLVVSSIRTQRVTFIRGETGSGKTTQVPQYILDHFRRPDLRVVITQPRRVAAVSLARRVAEERGERLGETVGYGIGGDVVPGKLQFMTTGFLLQMLAGCPRKFASITHVVLDEVHERSMDADMLNLVVKLLMRQHPGVKLIIMSATLQADLFYDYFGELRGASDEAASGPIFVGGKRYPLKEMYLEEIVAEYGAHLRACSNKALQKLVGKFESGQMQDRKTLSQHVAACEQIVADLVRSVGAPGSTVVVFLPGMADITALFDVLLALEREETGGQSYRVFALHSLIPRNDVEDAFRPPSPACIHVVLASNIAESSLTLPAVSAVVDLGLQRRIVYDSRLRMPCLATVWCSQASVAQRAGRAGRTMPGTVVRLFTRNFFAEMAPFDPPEVASAPIPRLYLQGKRLATKLCGEDGAPRSAMEVLSKLAQPPDLTTIEATREELASLGAITASNEDARITVLGELCLSLPFDLPLCRLVWLGAMWGCAVDAIVIASCLSTRDPFTMPSRLLVKDEADFVAKLGRSAASREDFDGGRLSEPLMYRELFVRWWTTLPQGERCRRKWMLHAWAMGDRHAVMGRKLGDLACQVADASRRVLRLCDPGSQVASSLRGLLGGMGLDVGPGEELLRAAKAARRPCDGQQVKVFEADVDVLRCMLAAAFSSNLLSGAPDPKRQSKWSAPLEKHSLDRARTLVLPNLPKDLQDTGVVIRLAALISGHQPERVVATSSGTLLEMPPDGEEGVDPPSQTLPLGRLARSALALFQFGAGRPCAVPWQVSAEGSSERKEVQLPALTHPDFLCWQLITGAPAAVQKGGKLRRTQGLLEWRNPVSSVRGTGQAPPDDKGTGFCHVLGCCAAVQGLENGFRAFVSGMTVLQVSEALWLLSTLDLSKTSLEFGIPQDAHCGADAVALRVGGCKVECACSTEQLELVCSIRAELRSALLAPVGMHALCDCASVQQAVRGLCQSHPFAVASDCHGGKLRWLGGLSPERLPEVDSLRPLPMLTIPEDSAVAANLPSESVGFREKRLRREAEEKRRAVQLCSEGVLAGGPIGEAAAPPFASALSELEPAILRLASMAASYLHAHHPAVVKLTDVNMACGGQGVIAIVLEDARGHCPRGIGKKGSFKVAFFTALPKVFEVETKGTEALVRLRAVALEQEGAYAAAQQAEAKAASSRTETATRAWVPLEPRRTELKEKARAAAVAGDEAGVMRVKAEKWKLYEQTVRRWRRAKQETLAAFVRLQFASDVGTRLLSVEELNRRVQGELKATTSLTVQERAQIRVDESLLRRLGLQGSTLVAVENSDTSAKVTERLA